MDHRPMAQGPQNHRLSRTVHAHTLSLFPTHRDRETYPSLKFTPHVCNHPVSVCTYSGQNTTAVISSILSHVSPRLKPWHRSQHHCSNGSDLKEASIMLFLWEPLEKSTRPLNACSCHRVAINHSWWSAGFFHPAWEPI